MHFIRCSILMFLFFKQKTAYEMRISDWSSDVCSSDLRLAGSLLFGKVFREFPGGLGSRRVDRDVLVGGRQVAELGFGGGCGRQAHGNPHTQCYRDDCKAGASYRMSVERQFIARHLAVGGARQAGDEEPFARASV